MIHFNEIGGLHENGASLQFLHTREGLLEMGRGRAITVSNLNTTKLQENEKSTAHRNDSTVAERVLFTWVVIS